LLRTHLNLVVPGSDETLSAEISYDQVMTGFYLLAFSV